MTGWIKTENVVATTGMGAMFNIHGMGETRTRAITGTKDWTKVELEFETELDEEIQLNCLFGGWGFATGKAWYDDIRIEFLESKEFKIDPKVAINTNETGEPISKYIYGQFIEHLGRCIYGGIWAEMLEDRKFYFPITANYDPYDEDENGHDKAGGHFPILKRSAWEIIGGADSVEMVEEDPYIEKHTPKINSKGGIAQNYLGLEKGKKYAGRIVLSGSLEAAPVQVSLVWGKGENDRDTVTIKKLPSNYTKIPLKFKSKGTTDNGRLEIVAKGKGSIMVGAVSLMPADNVHGMRKDTLALLKELDSPVYRWPGGNFVSGYDWRDGIGDPDKRPVRTNPAWDGMEYNDFGIHEFIKFCELLDTEPFIAVNTGLGTVESLKEEIEYCNGSTDTPMGKWRAENGRKKPFRVKWWAVGNEMYGDWQLGHMPLEDYIKKHNASAEAMWSVDPDAQLIAVGETGQWSEGMMKNSADHMNLISEHFYNGGKAGVMSHVKQITDNIKNKAITHRRYRKEFDSLKDKDIRIAMDEWNYWYGPHVFGELGVRYFLKDALGIAAGIHEYSRNTDIIYMANYAQTVNVIGCIKTTKTKAGWASTGQVLKLYRKEYGTIPVKVTGDTMPLDVAAAWTEDRETLTIGIVNPFAEEYKLPVDFQGAKPSGDGTMWLITGPDAMAYNVPGEKPKIDIKEIDVEDISDTLTVPPLSVVLYALEMK